MQESTANETPPAVSLLTAKTVRRHESGAGRFAFVILVLLWTVFVTPGTARATESEWQSIESIGRAAEDFVHQRYASHDARVTPVAGYLDPRLRLSNCDTSLEAFVRRGTKVSSRTVVGVRCAGGKPWKVYVPVNVIVTQAVLVAKRTLPRGTALTANDVIIEDRDVSMFRNGYLSSIDSLVDQRLKRQVEAGRVLTPSMLVADKLIRRGQAVTLIVSNDQINIRMAGRALSDGALNQRIRVENTNSGRVVEGIVRSREQVEILVR